MEKTWEMERVEDVNITEACNRVLAEDIRADFSIPGFARAAMDGYAVIASDTFGAGAREPVKLRLIGKIFAGDVIARLPKETSKTKERL